MTYAAFAPLTTNYDLPGAFDLDAGYHDPCVIERAGRLFVPDRDVHPALRHFVGQVAAIANAAGLAEPVGDACLRVIDVTTPQVTQRWHTDNDDSGVRFTTAIASDGWPVNLAFLHDDDRVGEPVNAAHPHAQYPNGWTMVFRREPHGALPSPPRPGQRTAVFFATLYPSRRDLDLYTNHCGNGPVHQILPALEAEVA